MGYQVLQQYRQGEELSDSCLGQSQTLARVAPCTRCEHGAEGSTHCKLKAWMPA